MKTKTELIKKGLLQDKMLQHHGHTRLVKGAVLSLRASKVLFSAGLISTLISCGGDSSDDSDPTPTQIPTQVPTQVPTQAPTQTPTPEPTPTPNPLRLIQGTDNNSKSSSLLSLNPGGPGGSPNQSLRAGDVLIGYESNDILIGGLGVDVLLGYEGNDILIGGTEDFNSSVDGDDRGADNRDRALGHTGDDVFIWSPGDGSDFFNGGEGTDVVIFGVLGESQDATGNTEGAPFFAVNPPNTEGSQDFDGIYLDENNLPSIRVSNSPGFCSVVDTATHAEQFDQLNIDHIVRFTLRNIANQFDAGERDDDDGLRVSVTLKNTEFVVCTKREVDADNSGNNIEVIDISGPVPVAAEITDLPVYIQSLVF